MACSMGIFIRTHTYSIMVIMMVKAFTLNIMLNKIIKNFFFQKRSTQEIYRVDGHSISHL